MNLLKEKEHIRSKLKKKRDSINKELRTQKSQKITNFLYEIDKFKYSTNIFCYISHINEVETHPLINFILERNIDLFVPKIISSVEMVAIRLNNLSNLEPDNIGILTPKSGEISSDTIDIAVTPGLGFTKKGERMGYGRGYYDRWFSKNKVKTKIGFAFEEQIVTYLPLEKTDINMDIVITEKEIIKLTI
mgnify:CR=1 FL=1